MKDRFAELPDFTRDLFQAHIRLYLEDPERAHFWDATSVGGPEASPTLLLTTLGRKSGEWRHAPVLYTPHEGGYLVLASKGGCSTHPQWYLNLLDHADCEIRVSRFHSKARAREVTGAERDRVWDTVTTAQPVYLKYQNRTTREIPIILLEPVAA